MGCCKSQTVVDGHPDNQKSCNTRGTLVILKWINKARDEANQYQFLISKFEFFIIERRRKWSGYWAWKNRRFISKHLSIKYLIKFMSELGETLLTILLVLIKIN